VGPSKGVLAMLKADAYGHGLVPVARALERDGTVAALVVTALPEGLALRREGIEMPVIAHFSHYETSHGAMLDASLTPVLASTSDLGGFARAARRRGIRASVHVEIDTGMSRLGLREDEVAGFLAAAATHPEVVISGILTHLASADGESVTGSHRQLDAFERVSQAFHAAGHRPTMVHAANTAATFRLPRAHLSHVRTGIALFGGDRPSGATLRPAMRMATNVARLRCVRAGQTVSYGERWTASRPSVVATLPVGYAHGYPRRLFGNGEVLIRGRRCPVVGAICMEMTMVDVTDLGAAVQVDDEVVLVGHDGGEEIRATDLADAIDGIVEEIFCGIPKSVTRAYLTKPSTGEKDMAGERARGVTWRPNP
jgi:alanine racemase